MLTMSADRERCANPQREREREREREAVHRIQKSAVEQVPLQAMRMVWEAHPHLRAPRPSH